MGREFIRLIPAYVAERLGLAVRVKADLEKTVVFIGTDTEMGFVPIGTGFLVGFQTEEEVVVVVVTASHVIDDLSPATQARLAVRVNGEDGIAKTIPAYLNTRIDHPNKASDVTIFATPVDEHKHDFRVIMTDRETMAAGRADNMGVRPGDDICAIGLYTSHYGELANMPVVRSGHIAAVPTEPVWNRKGYAEAYLIELRTIAGLSGSPVFTTFLPVRIVNGELQTRKSDESGGNILGMLVGYHSVERKVDQIQVPRFGAHGASAAEETDSSDQLNTGFGVVIPFERVLDILEGPEWGKIMAERLSRKKAASGFRFAGPTGTGNDAS